MKITELPPLAPGERIDYGPDPNQFAELFVPSGTGPHPCVMFIHGGFWRAAFSLDHARYLCRALVTEGYAVWSVEYRRVGQPGGGYPGTLDDIRAAAHRLVDIPNIDVERVVAMGHSAGGQLALWLAAQRVIKLAGVVSLGGVCDLRRALELNLGRGAALEFIGASPEVHPEAYANASPIELLPFDVPQTLLHGDADDIVPIELSTGFAHASPNARLVRLTGADHFDVIDPRSPHWPRVIAEVGRFVHQPRSDSDRRVNLVEGSFDVADSPTGYDQAHP